MKRKTSLKKIEEKIMMGGTGAIYITSDFADLASSETANRALLRLEEKGVIRRVLFGVYEYPEYNDFLSEYVAPSADKVAQALARKFAWTIVPCGDTALNLLGLSTQVPAVWLYVSDGSYKEYTFGKTTIKFKRTTNREISKLSYKTALVVQALKALGKDNVTDTVLMKLIKGLSKVEKEKMFEEAKTVTSWVYEYIKIICKSEET